MGVQSPDGLGMVSMHGAAEGCTISAASLSVRVFGGIACALSTWTPGTR